MDQSRMVKAERERLIAQLQDATAGRFVLFPSQRDPLRRRSAASAHLRFFFFNNRMELSRDFDIIIRPLLYADSVASHRSSCNSDAAATEEIYRKRWGPTRVPIYNILVLLSTLILVSEAQVPVDGTDLSGCTTLHHAISTKPTFDPEYAQMLFDAPGGGAGASRAPTATAAACPRTRSA
ncbi:hypothetical protein V8D89_001712 [Ganoderma adspersum]